MKKAYLVFVSQTVRVVASTEAEASALGIAKARAENNNFQVEDILLDKLNPYRPEFDDENALTPADIFSYSFAGYSVLDVIAMAGNDEHDINAAEAKQILDQVKDKHPHALDLNVNLMTEFIGLFIANRENVKT